MTSIGNFISELRTKNTKITYKSSLFAFLDWKYGAQRSGKGVSPKELERYETFGDRYISENNDYAKDLKDFAVSTQGIPPMTARIRMASIKMFLEYHDIELSNKQVKDIKKKMPRGMAATIERDLDHDTLRKILIHMDVKGKALILTLISSGMRIGEALQIKSSDVNLEKEPAEVTIRQEITKTRQKRVGFLSLEAAQAIREWLKVRDAYLKSAQNRNAGFLTKGIGAVKKINDARLFPFSAQVARVIWMNAVTNSNLHSVDEVTGRSQLHIHQTRKFFRSQLALSCPVDITEALMGHEGYLTGAYRRYTKDQMAEYYRQAERLVTIEIPSTEIGHFQTEIKKEMVDQQQSIAVLVSRNRQLEQKINTMETVMEALSRRPDIMKEAIKEKIG
jgi:integrase